jgi:2-oxoglutarate/2-oxoacid ferredoxin oxidoreductase subunit beta
MNQTCFDSKDTDISWCPGCGNFSILKAIKQTLVELELSPNKVVMVSGIGQAAKLPHYISTNFFNGLHGRALPPATAIKAANPNLTVVVTSGDGDMYGEGGNHFIHTIRRNPDITSLIHNNMVYGLTKGQSSPTSLKGFQTPDHLQGVTNEPLNPLALAISLNASFVARCFAGDIPQTSAIIKKAIQHKGYSIVDIFQPCVTFNQVNTFRWFKENTYYLESDHDTKNRVAAFQRALETDRLPLGIFFEEAGRPTFEENTGVYKNGLTPLYEHKVEREKLRALIEQYRT